MISNSIAINAILAELAAARTKFPDTEDMLPALMEEVGELSQALIQQKHEPAKGVVGRDIFNEAKQVAVMAIRLMTEGDKNFHRYNPSAAILVSNGEYYPVPPRDSGYFNKWDKGFIYLATPYAHQDEDVQNWRYTQVTAAAAMLISQNIAVYSPITHNHKFKLNLPWEGGWRIQDFAILSHASELRILMLDGWQESIGVTDEIGHAERMGIPIIYQDPETGETSNKPKD